MAKKKPLHWVKLDNAAKIYPAASSHTWSNVFRQSVTLKEEVDAEVLRSALETTVKRFPTIAARLGKGAFWYYLQQVDGAPALKEEQSFPLIYMSKEEMGKCAFRVIPYGRRIAVEFFHSLTDGTGALIFLKSLTAEYLEQKHGISIPCEYGVLDRKEAPRKEEMEDSFLSYAGKVNVSRKATDAWRLSQRDYKRENFLFLTCLKLPVKQILELAHRYGVTVTVLLSAVMMKALLELQEEQVPVRKKQKRIKLLIPVNLRQLFPSESLRNFAMYTVPEADPRMGDYTLEELCGVVKHKMGTEITQKHMAGMIATNVKDERNPFLRVVPLPLKNLAMKAVFNRVGERKSCLTLSNLGQVKLPETMRPYVERFDFILGVQAAAPYNCGMLSYGDTVYINFIRNTREGGLERRFAAILRDLGVTVTAESNFNGEN